MWEFPNIKTVSLANQRTQEELMKRGMGDRSIEFKLPLYFFEEFDVFSDFLLQNLYAIEPTGEGEESHYYFVESINYNFMKETITISAIDLQWILSQFFIVGDENVIALNWTDASATDKLFGYLCNEVTGEFEDGEQGKMLMTEEN